MGTKITLDHDGVGQVLRSGEVRAAVSALARTVAGNVVSHDRPVEVYDHVTDRAHSNVVIAHPAGMAMQAKYGTLTRAAAAAGLEVHGERP